ncbi:MAG: hypothetical protein QGG95_00390 [Nitrospinota bacterium]|nr:hypothetical protein [Nitrospinota bacterium]
MPCQNGAKDGVIILPWKHKGISGAVALTAIVGIVVVYRWLIAPEAPIIIYIIGQIGVISEKDRFPVAAL